MSEWQPVKVQVPGFLPPVWETQMAFLDPRFSSAQPLLFWMLGKKTSGCHLFVFLCMSDKKRFKVMKFSKHFDVVCVCIIENLP